MAQLLAGHGGSSVLDLLVPDEAGIPSTEACTWVTGLQVFAEETAHSLNSMNFDLSVQLAGNKLRGGGYITFSRTQQTAAGLDMGAGGSVEFDDQRGVLVYRSDSQWGKNGRFSWKDIQINTEKLCRGALWRPIEVQFWETGKKDRLVGRTLMASVDFEQCVRAERESGLFYNLRDDMGAVSGTVCVKMNEVVQQYSFLDYVTAGLEIGVMVGIDFTRSNGDPRSVDSLHAFAPNADGEYLPGDQNEYAMVIKSVLEILQQYDSDKQIPVYGFGAKLPPSNTITSHCFALSGDCFNPEVAGIAGVFQAYKDALGAVTLHGPTRFVDILKLAGQFAEPLRGIAKYCILLLITDGVIEDFQASVDEIVELAHLPLSIVIVGVGSEDFSQMKILDADDHPLVSSVTGATMHRDIVQFIPFGTFKDVSYAELARATLEEIPREVINYFSEKQVFPLVAPVTDARRRKYVGFSGLAVEVEKAAFLDKQKSALIKLVTDQGYDEGIVTRVVTETGILCPDPMHLIDVMFHMHRNRGVMRRTLGSVGMSIADRLGVHDSLAAEHRRVSSKRNSAAPRKSNLKTCGVCYSRPIDVKLKTCGHAVVCRTCFESLPPVCPLCRGVVSGVEDWVG